MLEECGVLDRGPGHRLAYARLKGEGPGVMFLGGFRSDMQGGKALHLRDRAAARNRAFLRFDYSGHGASEGVFEEGTIGGWLADAEAMLLARTQGPQMLVGSSMGGWLALLLAIRHPLRVAGLVLLAPAPDFPQELLWPALSDAQRAALVGLGRIELPSAYGPPVPITRRLVEEAKAHRLLPGPIPVRCPVRILQGMADPDVPWRHALRLVEALPGADVRLTLVKDGDHRLSRPGDLALLDEALDGLLRGYAPAGAGAPPSAANVAASPSL
jgi:pimeloyl-ACP methyl ester carboxylesterase